MNTNESKAISYKCTGCGASLNYRPGISTVHCAYCHTVNTIIPKTREETRSSEKKEFQIYDLRDGKVIQCKKCKAEFLEKDADDGNSCPACGIRFTQEEVHDGFYVAPTHYLPFRLSEEEGKKCLEYFLKEKKFPFPLTEPRPYSYVRTRRVFAPYWTDDMNVYIDDKELQNDYFKYRTFSVAASGHMNYMPGSILPLKRRSLFRIIEDESLKNEKVLLLSFHSKISENSPHMVMRQREVEFDSALAKSYSKEDVNKVKKVSLVLLPLYEYQIKCENKEYLFIQDGNDGRLFYKHLGNPPLPDFSPLKKALLIIYWICIFTTIFYFIFIH